MNASIFTTLYCPGIPIDSIPTEGLSSTQHDALWLQYQSVVGSLNWLAHTTCPDLSTVVSLLAQHQSHPSNGHLETANMWLSILLVLKVWVFNLQVNVVLFCNLFSIFHYHLKFYPCPMQIGVLRMPALPSLLLNYNYCLFPAQCQLIILISWELFIGYPSIKQ